MSDLTRIVAAVVDTHKATLYKVDGNTVEILQGDARLRPILEHITPLLESQGYADIDLGIANSWKEFEEKNTGGFRFFKIAKEKLKAFFSSTTPAPVAPMSVGVPVVSTIEAQPAPNVGMGVIDEIIKHAVPVTDPSFKEDTVAPQRPVADGENNTPNDRINNGKDEYYDKHPDTIVAVNPAGHVVPGVERIKSQFTSAAKREDTKGMVALLARLGKVIKQRQHTVEDLLRFMERGDMPVADDGTIVAFKKLYRKKDNEHGEYFVDPHTQRVRQKIGSYVHMRAEMVDPNRRNECSNGLHVGRRGYMGCFSGDAICIVKIRPEDVIAVPEYDANKMRVCGYHVLQQLTPAQYRAVNGNRPISDAEGGAELLAQVIAGNHVGILEMVEIGGPNGTDLKVTSVKEPENSGEKKPAPKKPLTARKKKKAAKKAAKDAKKKAKAIKPVKALDAEVSISDKPVDIKAVVARQNDASVSLVDEAPKPLLSQTDEVQALWTAALAGNRAKAQELLDFKKSKKKGWAVWGLDSSAGDTLKAIIDGTHRP